MVKIIVGNKVDKVGSPASSSQGHSALMELFTAEQDYLRTVTTEEGRRLADERGAIFFETSAKTMRGVEEVFDTVVDKVRSLSPQFPSNFG